MRTAARRTARFLLTLAALVPGMPSGRAQAQDFTYNPPGDLVSGSGEGREDDTVYVPGMRFPLETAPAYANSQVWGHGGMNGPGGNECDEENYVYPWFDNYCESRSWDMPLCPSGTGHQGQDIRPSTCADDTHWTVAAEDGTVGSIGSYSLSLVRADGTIHRYLHMEPSSIIVDVGDDVAQGERLGRASDAFGASSTTVHLHYDIFMNVDGVGDVYVPTYLSLVESYEELLGSEGSSCGAVPSEGGILDNKDLCFMLHGPLATWRYVSDTGYDGDLYWSYAWENDASNWAEWRLDFEDDGEYEVEVYITPAYAQSEETRYTVRHDGQTEELRLDQSAGDGWTSLGTFEFAAGGSQNVAVYDGPGEDLDLRRQFQADAIRLVSLDPPDPAEPDDAAEEEADAGEAPDAGDGPDLDDGPDAAPDAEDTPDADQDDEEEEEGDADREAPEGDAPAASSGERPVTVNSGCGCAATPLPSGDAFPWLLAALGLWLHRRCGTPRGGRRP